ncbi:hypothetical protein ILUMI_14887, partial [Ignelater luminosus]
MDELRATKDDLTPKDELHVEPILVCNYNQNRALTLLSTAKVAVKTAYNETYYVRVLLDSASTNNLITHELANKLKLYQNKVAINISGVNLNTTKPHNFVDVTIKSLSSNYKQTINCLLIDKITALVSSVSFNKRILKIPSNINLADNKFNEPSEIEASHFYEIIVRSYSSGDLPAQVLRNSSVISSAMTYGCISEHVLNDNIQSLWELENVKPENPSSLLSQEERECENHFSETVTRNKDGRIIVNIPWNNNVQNLAAYVLNNVTYGLKASSYLATKSPQHIAKENEKENAVCSHVIQNSFYVDDFIYSGVDPAVVKGVVHE